MSALRELVHEQWTRAQTSSVLFQNTYLTHCRAVSGRSFRMVAASESWLLEQRAPCNLIPIRLRIIGDRITETSHNMCAPNQQINTQLQG